MPDLVRIWAAKIEDGASKVNTSFVFILFFVSLARWMFLVGHITEGKNQCLTIGVLQEWSTRMKCQRVHFIQRPIVQFTVATRE